MSKHMAWVSVIALGALSWAAACQQTGTTVDSLAKELKLALQYPEGASV